MAITTKPKRNTNPPPDVDVDALINKGGSVATSAAPTLNEPDDDKIVAVLVRIPKSVLDTIDAQRKGKKVRVPRNTWIMEAIVERLEQETPNKAG